jgi:hypothetical protein
MIKIIPGLPAGMLGVEVEGKVTHEDYRDVLIPAAEKMLAQGPVAMLYVAGAGFTGYELSAMWDDAAFGLRHWRDFTHVAMVTDNAWIKGAASMFAPFFPGHVRVFPLTEMDKAKEWLGSAKKQDVAA